MATYGIEVKDSSGNVLLGNDYKLNRARYVSVVAPGNSGSVTLDDLEGKTTSIVAIPISNSFPTTDGAFWQHSVTRSGNTITWGSDSRVIYSTLIVVFVYG